MSFISGKLGFHLLKSGAAAFKSYDAIVDSIKSNGYQPIGPRDRIKMSFVNADSEIEDDFKQEPDNYGDREIMLYDILIQSKKPNPKVVMRRFKKEFKNQVEMMQSENREWKPDKEFKKQLKNKIEDEELEKAVAATKRVSIALIPEKGMLLINTKSPSVVGQISGYVASVCMDDIEDSAGILLVDLISDAVSRGFSKLQPFSVSPVFVNPPESGEDYIREFITWLFVRSIDEQDKVVESDDWAKVKFAMGDKELATLKTQASSDTLGDFGVANMVSGGIFDEARMILKDDNFKNEDAQIAFKIDYTGYMSDIDPAMEKGLRRENPTMAVMYAMDFYEVLKEQAKEFYKLRQKPIEWSTHAARLRTILKKRAEDIGSAFGEFEDDGESMLEED